MLFVVLTLILSSDLPSLDVLVSLRNLELFNFGTNFVKLVENGQNHKLDKPSLATSNVGGSSVAHHGDLEALSLFHITLIKELLEQQVCPVYRKVEVSETCTDVA